MFTTSFFAWAWLTLTVATTCSSGLSIIESSDPKTYLFAAQSTIFCESDVPFDLCVWSFGDAKCVSSTGSESNGSPCTDLPPGITWNIASDSRCGLLIEDPEIGVHDGDYTCLLGSFEDLSSGSMDMETASISLSVASPSNVQLFTADNGVIHLSNASHKVQSNVVCSSEGGIPRISGLHLYVNGIPAANKTSEGSFILQDIGPNNDGDILHCAGDQFSESGSPIYFNRSSPPLSLSVLYPPQIVNQHALRFMYEFIANPEPSTLKWEILDTQNKSLVYLKTETELKNTGRHKYLATLLIDLTNITVCDYVLTIENSEGTTEQRIEYSDTFLDIPEENPEGGTVDASIHWKLIIGILIAVAFMLLVGGIFYLVIRHCKYSRGAFYSSPQNESS